MRVCTEADDGLFHRSETRAFALGGVYAGERDKAVTYCVMTKNAESVSVCVCVCVYACVCVCVCASACVCARM